MDGTSESRDVPLELRARISKAYAELMDLTGGKRRRGQRLMIGEIARAVANSRLSNEDGSGARFLVAQGPTGVGKTYAYGCGAIPVALAAGLKVVICTATIGLQIQIRDKDLITLKQVIPEMTPLLVKGRGRLACPARMIEATDLEVSTPEIAAIAEDLLSRLDPEDWSGDIDELETPPDPSIWHYFTNDRSGCAGKKCPQYDVCPYYAARRAAETATVYVANQDFLLADLRAGGVMLPKPEETVYIIDEAHSLPGKALKGMSAQGGVQEGIDWAETVVKLAESVLNKNSHNTLGALADEAGGNAKQLKVALLQAKSELARRLRFGETRDTRNPYRFKVGQLPMWLQDIATKCERTSSIALEKLEMLLEELKGDEGEGIEDKLRQRIISEVGKVCDKGRGIAGVWKLMGQSEIGGAPVAKWIEPSPSGSDLLISASPVTAGQELHDLLWSKAAAAIHVSATLKSVGGFGHYLRESGLDLTPGVRTLDVESPFDYANKARLVVPKGMRSPKDEDGHTQDVCTTLQTALAMQPDGTGALVLFSSWRQLNAVVAQLPAELVETILVQGTLSKSELIDRHKRAIDAGMSSAVFGSAGLEEGIDLPGNYCTLVYIAKLQFSIPTHPVEEAQREYLEANGLSHFDLVALPHACKRLAQSAGRLLRTEDDEGWVVVADPRLTSTQYGRSMLAALPPYKVEIMDLGC